VPSVLVGSWKRRISVEVVGSASVSLNGVIYPTWEFSILSSLCVLEYSGGKAYRFAVKIQELHIGLIP
jgi:hypothetical protein